MRTITDKDIESLGISPVTCVDWVREAFCMKHECQLPPKVSVHPQGNDFITTMPCLLPESYHTFGVKVVSRILGNHPALQSQLLLFNSQTGTTEALIDTNWITSMRTGAVAALAIRTFRKEDSRTYAFVGLGNTAHATMKCLLATCPDEQLTVRLFRYKDQAERFAEHFAAYPNVSFVIVDTMEALVQGADVIVSCITDAQGLLIEDESLFAPGVLVVPVHTRGFQNCDTTFDKVFADDRGHVQGFKYFNQFRQFDEIANVLRGNANGRTSNQERILSYNIGLGLHDVYFAHKILQMID